MNRAILATCAALLATAGPAAGQTSSWNNPAGGNWNVGGNWSGGSVPGAGQDALIDLPGTYTVSLTDNRQIAAVTVNQAAATLAQSAGDLTATGLFTLQAGTLHLTGGRILANGGVTTAAGTTVRIDGGQLWATTLSGAPPVLNGAVEWSAGELHGTGSTTTTFALNGPVNLTGAGVRELASYGPVRLNGGGTWDAGRLIVDAFTKDFELPAGATVVNTTASGDFRLDGDGSVGSVFNLRGTFVKQGSNESMFWQTRVNNGGLLDVQAGRMLLLSHGTHTGVFQVASGATLQLHGQEDLNSGRLSVAGGGTLEVGWIAGGSATVSSSVTVDIASTATVRVAGGSFDLPANATLSPQALEVSGGRLTVRGVTRPDNVILRAGGEIWGGTDSGVNNDMTIGASGGTLTWEAGDFTFLRNVTVAGPANLPGTGSRTLWGSIAKGVTLNMTLNGGGTWDAGEVKMNGRAGITIPAGRTVTVTTAGGNFSVLPPDATADGGFVSVSGTLVKQGTNTLTFGRDISVSNSGHMDIRAGTVVVLEPVFSGGGGDYTLAPGTILQAPSIDVRGAGANKGVLQGEGTLRAFVDVKSGGRIRAGMGGPGVLSVGGSDIGNNSVSFQGDATDPPRIIVAAERTGPGTANAGRIAVSGLNSVIGFDVGSNNRVVEFEVVGTGLRLGETYSLVVATSTAGFQRNNGVPYLAAGYEFAATDYRLIGNYPGFEYVRLYLSDANMLTLQFTPVPEPAAVLAIAAGAAGLGGLIRRLAGKREQVEVG